MVQYNQKYAANSSCLQINDHRTFQTQLASQILSGRVKMSDVVNVMGKAMSESTQQKLDFKLESLTEKENEQLVSGMARIKNVCDFAVKSNKIRLLVDGEYTYMNPGISAVALSMMAAFNRKNAVVCNTYQCYLKVQVLLYVKTTGTR